MKRASPRRRAVWAVLTVVALASTACAAHAPQDSLNPKGPESRYIDHLFFPVGIIAVVIGLFVGGMVLYCIIRFRARSDDDAPKQTHGSTPLEITWTIIPLLLMFFVASLSVIGIAHLYRNPKGQRITFVPAAAGTPATIQGKVLEVHVIGHRWWWEFDYPGLGSMQDQFLSAGEQPGTALVTAGELHIPAGIMVRLDITSNEPAKSREGVGPGVEHNFWVPSLAGKIYAIPGHITHLNLEADASAVSDGHPVTYSGQCSEFCGIGHANMRIKVVAESPADFAAWVVNQQTKQHPLTTADQYTQPLAYTGYQLFNGAGTCSTCHTVQGTPAQGQVGPNLTHLQARGYFAGDIFQLNNNNLRTWLRSPQAAKPGALMIIPKLTEDQITALIAYLDTLK
ncbi:MAG TPA: cytochrome c oxidase subunit II [Acidimicrobiales bacterium]|nr:cytochrome c oxidase subunit II [Acidimicrobiales bacterium]